MSISPHADENRVKAPDIAYIPAQVASTSLFSDQALTVPGDQTSPSLQLCCLVEADHEPLYLTVSVNSEIGELKELIHGKCKWRSLSGTNAIDLILFKVSTGHLYEYQH